MSTRTRADEVFDFIVDYRECRGYPPSIREIGGALGMTSPSTVHAHLKTLLKQGRIKWEPSQRRTITLVDSGGER